MCNVLLRQFSHCVGWCWCLFDGGAAVWTCFAAVFSAAEPFAETAVAVCVTASKSEGFIEEAKADLASENGAEVFEEGGQGGMGLTCILVRRLRECGVGMHVPEWWLVVLPCSYLTRVC